MIFRTIYEDINLILRTCQWKVGKDPSAQKILSNWGMQWSHETVSITPSIGEHSSLYKSYVMDSFMLVVVSTFLFLL